MEYHCCDICDEVLKEEYYVLGVTLGTVHSAKYNPYQESVEDVFNSIQQEYQRSKQKLVLREICPNCYQILQRFFKLRIHERKKLEKELEKLEKKLEE